MALTWKDAATTLLAIGTALLAYAKYQGWQNWAIAPRLGFLILGAIGIGMCALSSPSGSPAIWTTVLSTLGVIALILIVLGLVTGSKLLFFGLAADILLLWLLATLRHLLVQA